MAQNYFSIVTNVGRNKLALSAAGGEEVTITHFAIGDGNGAEVNPTAASTALVREVWRTQVESVEIDPLNPSAVLVTAIIPTNVGGWWMREFGIFDRAGDMIAVAKPVSQYKSTALEGQLEDIRYEFQIIIGETANVTMLVDPSVLLASRDFVEKRKVPVAQLSLTPWVPVKSMTVTAPPANAAAWDTYVIPNGATGAWAGKAGGVAEWTGAAWNIFVPKDGHGIGLPDGRVFLRVAGTYIEWLASREWVTSRKTPVERLNSLPWLSVQSVTLTAPPAAPAAGDIYLIPAGSIGKWAGQAGKLAEWSGTDWTFIAPRDGHGVSLPDGRVFERIGGAYVEKIAQDVQSGRWVYVEDASPDVNRVVVSPTPALTALTAGLGLRVKAKNSSTGKSVMAVSGLPDKELVRLDGSTLYDSDIVAGGIYDFIYDGAKFRVLSALSTPQLRRPITLHVNAAIGNDANDGSANDAAHAIASIQGAVDQAFAYGPGPYTVTIRVAAATYGRVRIPERVGPTLSIIGDVATPGNVVINGGAGADTFSVYGSNVVSVSGVRAQMIQSGTERSGFISYGQSTLNVDRCETGAIDGASLQAYGGGVINVSNHRFTSSSRFMYRANVGGRISIAGTQTLVGVVPLGSAAAQADNGGVIVASPSNPVTFVNRENLAAGARYRVIMNGLIDTVGGGPNFFPGVGDGATSTGGQYV
ncbi:phage tail protein [Phyllobacterium leguminum]|uniref:Uncharacterized protein DUF2793 n=1 Tax=Phyllobacterium leguminum TaxID=314237 RepID=A0A318T0X1_9HYPH|nr:phage tail protein [Phyllobacterium leguminum]PYE87389.1 uncharacterized protein DUF2793 [Phyllobacterium leguminum]